MGLHLELVSHDERFERAQRLRPKIVNDLSESTAMNKTENDNLIYKRYQPTDLLSNTPSCQCMNLRAEYYRGQICPICNTEVQAPMEQDLEPILWMRRPEGVSKLMNHDAFGMLCDHFMISGFDLIRYFMDRTWIPEIKIPPIVDELKNQGLVRGYNNFVDNFWQIMDMLFSRKEFSKKGVKSRFQELLEMYSDCIFSEHWPLPNRSILVVENTDMDNFVDPIIPQAIDAIETVVSIDSPLNNFSPREKENRVMKALVQLCAFYRGYRADNLAQKEGVIRNHLVGWRSYFSGRAVISSTSKGYRWVGEGEPPQPLDLEIALQDEDPTHILPEGWVANRADELSLPWGLAVGMMRVHLKSKLFHRGYSFKEANSLLNDHVQRYHPLIDQLFKELISEAGDRGIAVQFQRNPSLERGSAQLMYIVAVKTNLSDVTISLHLMSVKGFNADFDGDQLNITMLMDKEIERALEGLKTHKSAIGLDKPYDMSKNNSLPSAMVSTVSNWVHSEIDTDPRKLALMEEMFEPD